MNDKEKAREYAASKHKDKELQKIVAWDFIAGAEWKEQQMISQMKDFIAEYFYEHPHTSWLLCSDEFQDLDDCFERLERYLKED